MKICWSVNWKTGGVDFISLYFLYSTFCPALVSRGICACFGAEFLRRRMNTQYAGLSRKGRRQLKNKYMIYGHFIRREREAIAHLCNLELILKTHFFLCKINLNLLNWIERGGGVELDFNWSLPLEENGKLLHHTLRCVEVETERDLCPNLRINFPKKEVVLSLGKGPIR